jgi:hypothetical protein
MKCVHILSDGKCAGMYKGFTCIGDKCRSEKEAPCEFYDKGFYCKKFGRFGCVGLSKCSGTLEQYMKVANSDRAKA